MDPKDKQMQQEKVQQVLRNVPSQFRKFPPEDLLEFLMTGQLEIHNAGQIIVTEGSRQVSSAWLVVDGELSVWKEGVEISQLGAGDFFGEEFLFRSGMRIATVIADIEVTMFRFEKEAFSEFFRTRPGRFFEIFMMNMLQNQRRRIKDMNNKVARLQKELLEIKSGTKA